MRHEKTGSISTKVTMEPVFYFIGYYKYATTTAKDRYPTPRRLKKKAASASITHHNRTASSTISQSPSTRKWTS